MVSRRAMIAGGIGAAALAGAGYRIWDRGVFAGVGGPAYDPWATWQGSIVDGIARPLHAAILAANPHDTQPWLFEIVNDTIVVYADRIRNLGSFDPFRREMHLGLGAAIENLVRAASVFGYTPYVRPVPGRLADTPPDTPVAVAHILMDPGAPSRDELFEAIPDRHTSRGRYLDRPVPPGALQRLAAQVNDADVRLVLLTDAAARKDLASLVVGATERIVADPQMSADSARWIRTGRSEVEEHRDGVTVDAAGLSPATVMLAKLLPDQSPASQDRYWLANTRDVQVHAPVLGVILVKDRLDRVQSLSAGRAWQRFHLAATAAGFAAQPLNQPVECIDRNAMLGRADTWQNDLVKIAAAPGWQPTFVFRLGVAEKPAPLSPRRPLSMVMKSSGLA
ncbi:MAG TPA: nitroreductase family protein [Rhizomicrobium sp.]|nr:nitroreductase family protein [Rhizomicrobium sp.]